MKNEERVARVSKKIRKGDKVIAISGNSRGLTGTVISCRGEKVIVEGLNVRKRHVKGRGDRPGEIIKLEKPIHISNLKVCTAENQPVRLHVREEDGKRQLYYKDGAKEVVYRAVKKS